MTVFAVRGVPPDYAVHVAGATSAMPQVDPGMGLPCVTPDFMYR